LADKKFLEFISILAISTLFATIFAKVLESLSQSGLAGLLQSFEKIVIQISRIYITYYIYIPYNVSGFLA